jgi:hypothetical protein
MEFHVPLGYQGYADTIQGILENFHDVIGSLYPVNKKIRPGEERIVSDAGNVYQDLSAGCCFAGTYFP